MIDTSFPILVCCVRLIAVITSMKDGELPLQIISGKTLKSISSSSHPTNSLNARDDQEELGWDRKGKGRRLSHVELQSRDTYHPSMQAT